MRNTASLLTLTLFLICTIMNASAQKTFTNPLFAAGADPWCVYENGYYYYTHTTGRNVTLWRAKSIAELKNGESKIVFTPPASGPYSKEIWAPEIHRIRNKWYIYFAADSGNNVDHRMWVLENTSKNPLEGEWKVKGKLTTPEDKWSIDGSVFRHRGKYYFVWSGWQGDVNGQQDIFIARMKNPWTIKGKRVRISSPQLDWETHGDLNNPNDVPHVNVNEGPQYLAHGKKVFLIYSASGCWTDNYSLGMLEIPRKGNLMDSAAWTKHPTPVFTQAPENGVYAPGHNSFFKSPDGKEDWILYHANDQPGQGCGGFRSPRAQPFSWDAEGKPVFGKPLKKGTPIPVPSE